MDIFVLDSGFNQIGIVDIFESFIWTERYAKPGDFELQVPRTKENLNLLKKDNWLEILDSKKTMCIETIEPDMNDGSKLLIKGRSLESILERRVHATVAYLPVRMNNICYQLAQDNFINPVNTNRKISNFTWVNATDADLVELDLADQEVRFGENVLDIVQKLCENFNIGFRIHRRVSDNFLVWEIYNADDRSWGNEWNNPPIVFSPDLDNIADNSYIEDSSVWKNVALVGGQVLSETARYYDWVGLNAPTGIGRREMFVDKNDFSTDQKTDANGNLIPLTDTEWNTYHRKLRRMGKDELYKNPISRVYDGTIDMSRSYKYGVDFFLGDIVQFVNRDELAFKAQIVEFIRSYTNTGVNAYPTFKVLEDS